jgi:hypothetical protein
MLQIPLGGKIQQEDSMVKKTLCTLALVAALIPFVCRSAAAQNYQGPPKPAISDYGPFTNALPPVNPDTKPAQAGTCGNPAGTCLFYGGDFSPTYTFLANGLANENDTLIGGVPFGAATWVPFTVPAGQTWSVTGLFTNNFSSYGVLDQNGKSVAYWSINQGLLPGHGGTVVAKGLSSATSTLTGRSDFDFEEYTIQVTGLSVTLASGSYWLAVVPVCTNQDDPFCSGEFFLSDSEYVDTLPANAFGPAEPIDTAFFDSSYFGITWEPTGGAVGACGGIGCDVFSAGVLGSSSN